MFRFRSHRAMVVATIFTLSACGGGGGGGGGGGSVTPHTTPTPTATATPPAAPGTTATVTFTAWAGQPKPTSVAYEVNGGTWQAATLPRTTLSEVTLTIPLPAGATSYGFGFTCPTDDGYTSQQLFELSPKDTTAVTNVGCTSDYSAPAISVGYNSTAIGAATGGTIQTAAAGYNYRQAYTATTGTLGVEYGPSTSDVMETATVFGCAIAMHLLRSQLLTPSESLPFPDMSASDATNSTEMLTASAPGYSANSVTTAYQTADGASFNTCGAGGLAAPIPQIAVAQAMPGDGYSLTAAGALLATNDSATTQIITANPTSQTITVPPVWTFTAPAASDTPTFPVNYSEFSVSGFGYDKIKNYSPNSVTVFVVSKTVAGTAATLSVPNLSAIAGFFNPFPSGVNNSWSVALVQSNATSWISPGTNFPVGSEIQTQSITGSFVAP